MNPPIISEINFMHSQFFSIFCIKFYFVKFIRIYLFRDRDMDLRLELDPAIEGYIWVGVTKTNLGILAPTNQLNLTVSIFPFRTGLINVSGIRLVDLNRGEKFCFNDLTQVLVLQK